MIRQIITFILTTRYFHILDLVLLRFHLILPKIDFTFYYSWREFFKRRKCKGNTTFLFIISFFLNKVFVAARKHNTKRNKTGFIVKACDTPPLNSHVKNKTIFEFLFYGMFYCVNQKHFRQNIRENIVQCWFYVTSIKILHA